MLLTSWKSLVSQCFRNSNRKPRPRRRKMPAPVVGAESLESRTLLTTMFYVDFGTAIPAAGMSSTVEEFREIDGPGANGYGTGSDLEGRAGLADGDTLNYQPIQYDFNGDSVIDVYDAIALQDAVLPIIQRELWPFDINVMGIGSATLADASGWLQSNDAGMPGFDGFGENDVYSFVMDLNSPAITVSGGSVGLATGLYGVAARQDLYTGVGNLHDEATLTFTDKVLTATNGVPGTDAFNENLAYRLAYTIVHEGAHTFTLVHTKGQTSDERMLSSGDVIRKGSQTRETNNIVTRFDLQRNGSTTLVNNYDVLAQDADIGLRDSNRDGVPDFAYVTGTGAHDRIILTDLGGGVTNVQIDAYSDSAMLNLIRSDSYTITDGVDTEGMIVIDSSVNDDNVWVDASVTATVMVRGGDGDDVIQGGSGNDLLFGENGSDVIRGGAGNDVIYGQADADVLYGEAGNDLVLGQDGADRLYGNGGHDILLGGDGNDIILGGAGNDVLRGQLGNDILSAGLGNDILIGDEGDDFLIGGQGRDWIFGGLGNDFAWGGAGNDAMFGGAGNDNFDGGFGNDWIFGGAGHDRLRGGDGRDVLYGGSGNDDMNGGAGNDRMRGGSGNDRMVGGDGSDRMYGDSGHDAMSGGNGNDRLVGGTGNDRMSGGAGNDAMLGGAGNDMISGGAGNDILLGQAGSDWLFGGSGDDILIGGADLDVLFGGPGLDLLFP